MGALVRACTTAHNAHQGLMSHAWKGGSSTGWRAIRAAVLSRDQYVCQVQVAGVCTGAAQCVHHIHGRAITGDDMRYLQASCTACNLHIGEPNKPDPEIRSVTKW